MRSRRHLDVQGYQMSKYEKDLQKNIVYASEYEQLSRRNEHVVRCS